jgi:sulfatase modifying factor 1
MTASPTALAPAMAIVALGACGRLDFDIVPGRDTAPTCPPCASNQGAAAIAVAAGSACYCVDATEVTNARYLAYLDAGAPPSSRPECAWKTTYVPSTWPPTSDELDWPVATVDWCDADAMCVWAGERLCGAIGGGPASFTNGLADNQWYVACSHDGERLYPYGSAYIAGACWDSQPITATVAAVASHPECEGGFAGIFDMSGNVNEWIDACDGATGSNDMCDDGGGGKYYQATEGVACTSIESRTRNQQHSDVGFRCCSP